MSDQPATPPPARVRRSRGITFVWIIPILAFCVVAYLGVKTLVERGPLITVTFQTAEGLEAGRTQVRYKGVDVGMVESVRLAPDLGGVIVTARLDRGVADAVTNTTQFWVARPRVSAAGISGLSTIVSGSYLEMQPGRPGPAQYDFKGLEDPPVLMPPMPGRRFTLHAPKLGGLGYGAPIFHHGVDVGEVLGTELSAKGDDVLIFAYVRAPFDDLVHTDTRFWNAGGFSISVGAQGVTANMESLQALVAGGIAFDGRAMPPAAVVAKPDTEFKLYADKSAADTEPSGETVQYRVLFPRVVPGLGPGTEVELKGIDVGRVSSVSLVYDVTTSEVSSPTTIDIYPERISFGSQPVPADGGVKPFLDNVMTDLVRHGLRARLASGSLITGARIVSLETDPTNPPADVTREDTMLVIPTIEAGDLDSLTHSADQLMKKIGTMPLAEIGSSIRNVLQHLDKITEPPDVKQTIRALNEALQSLTKLSNTTNAELPALVGSLRQTSDAATRTLQALGGQDARGADLPTLLHELTEAARSLRSLADFLQEHPEALIKGRSGSGQ